MNPLRTALLRLSRQTFWNASNRVRFESTLSQAEQKWRERDNILANYSKLRNFLKNEFVLRHKIKPGQVFPVNQTNFSDIKVLGFDYDYTLAEYSDDMQKFIYETAVKILIKNRKFPTALIHEPYIPDFCVRGLHYDIKRGLLMKIDERHRVQTDTVFRGRKKLSTQEAMAELGDEHIPKIAMDESCFRGSGNLQQLTDIFSLPEMLLLANVVHFFTKHKIPYDPCSVFDAVENSVKEVHIHGHLYKEISKNVEKYLEKWRLVPLINKLKRDGKRLFILTNSRFPCVDVGMRHMLGSDWRDAFELVVVDAKKPQFFDKADKPFKTVLLSSPSTNGSQVSWDTIKELKRDEVYCEGCCSELMRLKGWKGKEVMYVGDQIYADLQSPNQSNGWYTAAIIHELKREIDVMNTDEFARNVVLVQMLEKQIERMQDYSDSDSRMLVANWKDEREEVKKILKDVFNPRFGSVFRSSLQGSYFSARLCLVADIYTSSVMNFIDYPGDKIFFPPRGSHPHEQLVASGYQHDGFDSALLALQTGA